MKIIIVTKTGSIKELDWKTKVDLSNVYKKAGLRKEKDFEKRHTWKINDGKFVTVYSKNAGRANTENKYELPPPVDSDLYFGKLVIIKHTEEIITEENCEDMDADGWAVVYDGLMGGFEDLNGSEDESEEEYVAPEDLTKEGYEKDGFVVSDGVIQVTESDEEEEWISANDTDEEEEEEEEEEQKVESESEDETGDETDSSIPSIISGSDNELKEEDYEY